MMYDDEDNVCDTEGNALVGAFWAIVIGLFVTAIIIGIATCFFGCASHTAASPHVNPTTQPAADPVGSVEHSIGTLITLSEWVNGVSLLALAVGIGLTVYSVVTADKPLEHLGLMVAAVAGSGVVLGLVGIIVLPFAPWLVLGLGVIGLGGLSYEIYIRFFKKNLPPAIPVVK